MDTSNEEKREQLKKLGWTTCDNLGSLFWRNPATGRFMREDDAFALLEAKNIQSAE